MCIIEASAQLGCQSKALDYNWPRWVFPGSQRSCVQALAGSVGTRAALSTWNWLQLSQIERSLHRMVMMAWHASDWAPLPTQVRLLTFHLFPVVELKQRGEQESRPGAAIKAGHLRHNEVPVWDPQIKNKFICAVSWVIWENKNTRSMQK